jgi:hypothetical protein
MSTIKSQVLKEFSDAKCVSVKKDMFVIKSSKCNGISQYTEEDAWIYFYMSYCKPLPPQPKSYKDLVKEKFPRTKLLISNNKYYISLETGVFINPEDAWQDFNNLYCKDTPGLIINNEYEVSNDYDNYHKRLFKGFAADDFGGHREIYNDIRPIQKNHKLDQLKQLAEELGFNLTLK